MEATGFHMDVYVSTFQRHLEIADKFREGYKWSDILWGWRCAGVKRLEAKIRLRDELRFFGNIGEWYEIAKILKEAYR